MPSPLRPTGGGLAQRPDGPVRTIPRSDSSKSARAGARGSRITTSMGPGSVRAKRILPSGARKIVPHHRRLGAMADAEEALGEEVLAPLHALDVGKREVAVARERHLGAGGRQHPGQRARHVEVEGGGTRAALAQAAAL